MNEKTLFIVCVVISIATLVPFRKRMRLKTYIVCNITLPFVIYIALLIAIIALALIYGDH